MGRASRRKARRPPSPPSGSSRPIRTLADFDAISGTLLASMPGRVTYLTDPVLGGGQPVAGIGPGGKLIPDASGTIEPLPVILFEPAQATVLSNPVTGQAQELRTETIIAAGFSRVPPGPVWAIKPAPGWEVRRQPGELVLRDGSGEIWARSAITPDPAWVSAAASYRHVIVFYGPQLGVRLPPGTSPASYTTTKRAAEVRKARSQGLVTAATVTWCGQATGDTLEWVPFLPGSFGLSIPGLFAPAADFARHGGPEMFGLMRPADHGMTVPADPLNTLVARVSRTDIDLIDPAESEAFGWLGGVHYTEGIQPAWRQAALSQRHLLLLTGPSLPNYPAPGQRQDHSMHDELWGAIIPVQAA